MHATPVADGDSVPVGLHHGDNQLLTCHSGQGLGSGLGSGIFRFASPLRGNPTGELLLTALLTRSKAEPLAREVCAAMVANVRAGQVHVPGWGRG